MVESKGGGPLLPGGDGFWMDKLKQKGVATFRQTDHAAAAARGLSAAAHFVWPQGGGKALRSTYPHATSATEMTKQTPGARQEVRTPLLISSGSRDDGEEAERKARHEAILAMKKVCKSKRVSLDRGC